ncbi:MAG: PEP-utilizing enzyme [bacterium]
MKKYFTKATFWAREFRLPLFWLMDKDHQIMSEDTLIIYKGATIAAYHLDDREEILSREAYKFFHNKNGLIKYRTETANILKVISELGAQYQMVKMKNLSDGQLRAVFNEVLTCLNQYSNVYAKTEPFVLSKIEAEESRYKVIIKELGELRFKLRKEGEAIFYNFFGIVLKELARRRGIKVTDLFFYTSKDIGDLFKGKIVAKSSVVARSSGYVLVNKKKKSFILTGPEYKELSKAILNKKLVSELTGRVAMRGTAKGIVRLLLHNKRDISGMVKKFKIGEVLVTEMTRPDTVLACRKAAAIVTDEGGITSHAAIISREFKIPCVVGTKIATQVLKDGDLVEVDANKGVVRIIRKGKK